MNSDIEHWLNYIKKNKKRKRSEDIYIDSDEIIKSLKLVAVKGLEDIIKDLKLKGRRLTKTLTDSENLFCKSKIIYYNDYKKCKDSKEKEYYLMIIAFSSCAIEVIKEIKLEIYSYLSQGNEFNIKPLGYSGYNLLNKEIL